MLQEKYRKLYNHLTVAVDRKRMYHDPLYTLAYGTDASFYRMIPELVIKADNEKEVSFILKSCSEMNIPVTFRAAGTSLSGQAVSDSVLMIAGDAWKKYSISAGKEEITLQPGLTGGQANSLLAEFGLKIGPDPASLNAAMIGGIAANNASGMCCGTAENSYKTVTGITIIFSDGTILDTRKDSSKEQFIKSHPEIVDGITELAASVRRNSKLEERIRQKYKMKNTTGYSLNALVDFEDPFDIIMHLIIGSEGTLGFISDITLRTVVNQPYRASSLMIFPNIEKACKAEISMKSTPVAAVELIDRAGLRSVEAEKGIPAVIATLNEEACALLVETSALTGAVLENNIKQITASVRDIEAASNISFTSLPEEYEKLWKIRKGLFPSVGAMRKSGTNVIIEDVAFPIESLAEATLDLQSLLKKHGYADAVIFGHALEGNLHFVFSQDFGSGTEIKRYSEMMAEVSNLVVRKYDGSLKAEHGTGRNVAPFVELEWGSEAYGLMKRIKQLFDPKEILNPGVILNNDPAIHLKNLKPVQLSPEISEKCTECGFCEQSCVSAGLTLTPRQRIVVHKEILTLRATGKKPHIAASLSKAFKYEGEQTCATDGLCATACPVKIDCGKLIKSIRAENASSNPAMLIADNMKAVTAAARKSLSAVSLFHSVLGTGIMKGISGSLRTLSFNTIPAWNPYMPSGARKMKLSAPADTRIDKVVYFPSCINRSMGLSADQKEEQQLTEKMVSLLNKAGYDIIYPENMNSLCCGMAFSSKGYTDAGSRKLIELETALMKASNNGRYPILCDMSPCLYTMKENMSILLKLYEPVEFIHDHLIQRLNITPADEAVTVFPVCSLKKMGHEKKLLELAKLCAREVIVPETNCCGFAGDRGFTYPELNKHGLRNLRQQLPSNVKEGYSNSRTCEIGLSLHSGITYKSIVYLVDRVSKARL
jgi:D-lactate dehydrogenase